MTGAAPIKIIQDFLSAMNTKDSDVLISVFRAAEEQNIDPYIFIQMLVQAIRHILFIRFSKQEESRLKKELDPQEFEFYKDLASEKNNIHSGLLDALLESYKNMHVSFSKYMALELAVMKLIEEKSS